MYRISVEMGFSAAHQLVGYEGACENLHGHNWTVKVEVKTTKLDSLGMGLDFKKLKKLLGGVLEQFDHRMINQVAPFDQFNPTAENMAHFIFDALKSRLPKDVSMSRVKVSESPQCSVIYQEDSAE
ncbi:MAG TPA: 6-carboxytetrahydropterin synthase QueD [bacterium]|nr:6-carboxytetrahydropterin synthase QueD [bacterium]